MFPPKTSLMKININSDNSYLNKPCDRCGEKRRVAKRWKERIPTFSGTTVVEYSQIICLNKECQAKFEKQLIEERKKRDAVKAVREENAAIRKANSLEAKKRKKS